eukprot:TRINITY_DN316_c0_g2_i1.p1 TRINITY_DN316_c0_g2~~TRINITY_DN316_c0_g2_i1.p1  ORF type:complete len:796 (-),score=95.55 TRINITY_DN316_c0_g2_i1:83-2470(-)
MRLMTQPKSSYNPAAKSDKATVVWSEVSVDTVATLFEESAAEQIRANKKPIRINQASFIALFFEMMSSFWSRGGPPQRPEPGQLSPNGTALALNEIVNFLKFPVVINADEMGTGKTRATIELHRLLNKFARLKNYQTFVHVVAHPVGLADQWQKQYSQWYPEARVLRFDTKEAELIGFFIEHFLITDTAEPAFDVILMNQTQLEHLQATVSRLRMACCPIVILDEADQAFDDSSNMKQIKRTVTMIEALICLSRTLVAHDQSLQKWNHLLFGPKGHPLSERDVICALQALYQYYSADDLGEKEAVQKVTFQIQLEAQATKVSDVVADKASKLEDRISVHYGFDTDTVINVVSACQDDHIRMEWAHKLGLPSVPKPSSLSPFLTLFLASNSTKWRSEIVHLIEDLVFNALAEVTALQNYSTQVGAEVPSIKTAAELALAAVKHMFSLLPHPRDDILAVLAVQDTHSRRAVEDIERFLNFYQRWDPPTDALDPKDSEVHFTDKTVRFHTTVIAWQLDACCVSALGFKYAGYYGAHTSAFRQNQRKQFEDEHVFKCLLLSWVGAYGIHLVKSRRMRIVRWPKSPGEFLQAIKRQAREGQTRNCFVKLIIGCDEIGMRHFCRFAERLYDISRTSRLVVPETSLQLVPPQAPLSRSVLIEAPDVYSALERAIHACKITSDGAHPIRLMAPGEPVAPSKTTKFHPPIWNALSAVSPGADFKDAEDTMVTGVLPATEEPARDAAPNPFAFVHEVLQRNSEEFGQFLAARGIGGDRRDNICKTLATELAKAIRHIVNDAKDSI